MHKFKVGDIVQRAGFNNGNGAIIGQVATVVSVEKSFVGVRYNGYLPSERNPNVELWNTSFTELVKEREMNNVEVYNRMHDLAGIENGDKIELLRKWGPEEFGTNSCMGFSHKPGSLYTVKDSNHRNFSGFKMLLVEEGGFIPFFAAVLVEKKPKWEPMHLTLNAKHAAIVYHDKVVVGCQEFSFAAIENLAKTVAAAKASK